YSDPLKVVASRDNAWASRRKVALAELVGEPWCVPQTNHPVGAAVLDAFRRSGLSSPRAVVTAPSAPVTIALVSESRLLGVIGTNFLRTQVSRAALKALPVTLPVARQIVAAVTLKHRP